MADGDDNIQKSDFKRRYFQNAAQAEVLYAFHYAVFAVGSGWVVSTHPLFPMTGPTVLFSVVCVVCSVQTIRHLLSALDYTKLRDKE